MAGCSPSVVYASTQDPVTAQLRMSLAQQRTEVDRLRRQVAEVRRRGRSSGARGTPEGPDAFDLDLFREWHARFGQGQLRPFVLGEGFLDSLAGLQGVSRDKVVAVVVEVLAGVAKDLSGREQHPLRTGSGGDDPQRVRDDGAKAWRVALQRETPNARRLHYWERADGTVEPARVGVHDDLRI